MSNPNTKQSFSAIRSAIRAGIKLGAFKGDLQNLVWRALGRDLTIEEAAIASRYLAKTGYDPRCGFAPSGPGLAKALGRINHVRVAS